jgi:putative hemolysin
MISDFYLTLKNKKSFTPSFPNITPTLEPLTSALANPASVNCVNKGGQTHIQNKPNGSQYGLCFFDDNRACEEWAMFNGECPIGGRKTTGFDTDAQKFCAWSGGQTFAVENAICTFNDGSTCPDNDFYFGTCQKGTKIQSSQSH